MSVKITQQNAGKIETMLKEVNGNSSEHAFTSFNEIFQLALSAERKLEHLNIPKNARTYAACRAVSSGPVAKAYKCRRNGTKVELSRNSKDWFLDKVSHETLWPNQGGGFCVFLTQDQDQIAVKHFRSQYSVSGN